MKVSEAIEILKERLEEYGDLNIEVWDDMGEHVPDFKNRYGTIVC